MARYGGLKTKNNKPIIIMIILILLAIVSYTYMYNHYTTEEIAKFALLKYFLFD